MRLNGLTFNNLNVTNFMTANTLILIDALQECFHL